MGDVVAARSMFQRMKFELEAANKLITKEGIDSVEELRLLDKERCERIVARLVKPGGTLANGNANPGLEVSERATTNFAIAAKRAEMWHRCGRPFTLASIDLNDDFEVARRQMILEEKHVNDSSLIAPLTNNQLKDRNFIEFAEVILKKISKFRHTSGIPIGGPLRWKLIPDPHAADPAANYMTHDDEAVARFGIIKTAFLYKVFTIMFCP